MLSDSTLDLARVAAVLAFTSALSACALPTAVAHPRPPRAAIADVEVIDRSTGEQLPIHWHQGRRYVAGAPGNRYSVAVRNRSGGRVLAVIAVDGVNAVSGETAAWDQRGYVFAPGQRYEITGWRKSAEKIAAFEFTSLADAYATRTGRPDHVGVIGVALFREAPRVPAAPPLSLGEAPASSAPPSPAQRAESGGSGASAGRADGLADRLAGVHANEAAGDSAKASAEAMAREQRSRLGTGHGRIETSVVGFTDFERAGAAPDEVITIHYDRRENLVALGVIPPALPAPRPWPQPFPGSLGFVADPPR